MLLLAKVLLHKAVDKHGNDFMDDGHADSLKLYVSMFLDYSNIYILIQNT